MSDRNHTSSSSSSIHLYAELLLNIRTITLFATLSSNHTAETKASLSADGESVTLAHEGQSATIRLPNRISGGGSAGLHLPASPPSKELTLRLKLEDKPTRSGTGFLRLGGGEGGGGDDGSDGKENIVPWSAAELERGDEVRIECRGCGNLLVDQWNVKVWKDLPNENWAEMMDFWHCHKPGKNGAHDHGHGNGHEHEHEHDASKSKGYAASNKVRASQGVGLVDLSYFLLSEDDCCGVQPTKKPLDNENSATRKYLSCSSCATAVGIADDRAEGWRIYKWSVAIRNDDHDAAETHPVECWISASLLALADNQGVRKFVVHVEAHSDTSGEEEPLMLWLFTPDLRFSSSAGPTSRNDPTRATKIFWQLISDLADTDHKYNQNHTASNNRNHDPNHDHSSSQPLNSKPEPPSAVAHILRDQSASVEEVVLPPAVMRTLRSSLEDSAKLMPAVARRFKEWNVGLLMRFGNQLET